MSEREPRLLSSCVSAEEEDGQQLRYGAARGAHVQIEGVAIDAETLASWKEREGALPEAAEIDRVIRADATARRILSKGQMPVQGALVGVRLNLNIMRSTGVCVHTLHRGGKETGPAAGRGFWDGEVIGYAPVVTLENAWFSATKRGMRSDGLSM